MKRWSHALSRSSLIAALSLLTMPTSAAPQPRVDLITIGVGDQTYARFGHAAFEVRRGAQSVTVYNFGYSDFSRPDLVPEFLRGRSRFWVARQSRADMITEYMAEDRTITRQTLNLSPTQHRELIALLKEAALPENKYYIYHHFDDNCTTRLRDLLDRVTGKAIRRVWQNQSAGTTLRALMRRGFAGQPALQVVADTIAGHRADQDLSLWEAAFLPRIHSEAMQRVILASGRPLAGPPTMIYRRKGPDPTASGFNTGRWILWMLAAFSTLCLWAAGRGGPWTALPLSLGAVVFGALGTFLWALAVYSTLPELSQNELLFLFWPIDLVLVGRAINRARKRNPGKIVNFYIKLRLAMLAIVWLGHAAGWFWQGPKVWLISATLWILAMGLTSRNIGISTAKSRH